jgi:hypothetical protein
MNREDVIRMARNEYGIYAFTADSLAEFSSLVAAAEREAIWNLLFEYAGRDDLSDSDQSLLKHLLDLIAARWQEWRNVEEIEHE